MKRAVFSVMILLMIILVTSTANGTPRKYLKKYERLSTSINRAYAYLENIHTKLLHVIYEDKEKNVTGRKNCLQLNHTYSLLVQKCRTSGRRCQCPDDNISTTMMEYHACSQASIVCRGKILTVVEEIRRTLKSKEPNQELWPTYPENEFICQESAVNVDVYTGHRLLKMLWGIKHLRKGLLAGQHRIC